MGLTNSEDLATSTDYDGWQSDLEKGAKIISGLSGEIEAKQVDEDERVKFLNDYLKERVKGVLNNDNYESPNSADISPDVVASLYKAMVMSDPHLGHHQTRVALDSRNIAIKLGLDEETVKLAMEGAWIHDWGKIYTPSHIIYKPGRLTDKEYGIMKKHPVSGDRALRKVVTPAHREIIRHHHENWDGSGYPDGLKGEKISLGARIVRVADTLDAMLNRPFNVGRPGKGPLTLEQGLQIIQSLSGTHYDPQVVTALMQIYKKALD